MPSRIFHQGNLVDFTPRRCQKILHTDRIRIHLIEAKLITTQGQIVPFEEYSFSKRVRRRPARTTAFEAIETEETISERENPRPVLSASTARVGRPAEERSRSAVKLNRSIDERLFQQTAKRRRRTPSQHRTSKPSTQNQLIPLRRFINPTTVKEEEAVWITFKYYKPTVSVQYDRSWFEPNGDEIMVTQQHCGGENLIVYKGFVQYEALFDIKSRRHVNYPLALAFYINGIIKNRLSLCCEWRCRELTRIGGASGLFSIINVENSQPCRRCRFVAHIKNMEERKRSGRENAEGSQTIIVSPLIARPTGNESGYTTPSQPGTHRTSSARPSVDNINRRPRDSSSTSSDTESSSSSGNSRLVGIGMDRKVPQVKRSPDYEDDFSDSDISNPVKPNKKTSPTAQVSPMLSSKSPENQKGNKPNSDQSTNLGTSQPKPTVPNEADDTNHEKPSETTAGTKNDQQESFPIRPDEPRSSNVVSPEKANLPSSETQQNSNATNPPDPVPLAEQGKTSEPPKMKSTTEMTLLSEITKSPEPENSFEKNNYNTLSPLETTKPAQRKTSIESIESFESSKPMKNIKPVERKKSVDSIQSFESVESMKKTKPVETTKPVERKRSVDSIQSFESAESIRNTKPVETTEPVQRKPSIDPIQSVEKTKVLNSPTRNLSSSSDSSSSRSEKQLNRTPTRDTPNRPKSAKKKRSPENVRRVSSTSSDSSSNLKKGTMKPSNSRKSPSISSSSDDQDASSKEKINSKSAVQNTNEVVSNGQNSNREKRNESPKDEQSQGRRKTEDDFFESLTETRKVEQTDWADEFFNQ